MIPTPTSPLHFFLSSCLEVQRLSHPLFPSPLISLLCEPHFFRFIYNYGCRLWWQRRTISAQNQVVRDKQFASSTGDRLRAATYESLRSLPLVVVRRIGFSRSVDSEEFSESAELEKPIRRNSDFSHNFHYYESLYPRRRYESPNLRACRHLAIYDPGTAYNIQIWPPCRIH